MRVLYITPYVPSKIRVRPYNLIRSLAKRNEVTLVSLVQSDLDREALCEMTGICENVNPVKMSRMQSVSSCGRRLFTKMPLQAAYTYTTNLNRVVDDLIIKNPFDVVHVEHIRGAHFAAHIGSLPKVYDSVDCITLLLRQFLATKKNPFAWCLALEEWAKMRTYEAMISEKFEKVVITSSHDRKALEGLIWERVRKDSGIENLPKSPPNRAENIEEWRLTRKLIEMSQDQRLAALTSSDNRVAVVPNGVDHQYFSPMDVPEQPDTIVFTGKMGYYANAAAVKYFYENVFPLIRKERPNAKFIIAGADPPASVKKLAKDKSVTVTGYVDDIRPYLAGAAVAVCPMTVSVGIQNKVLEAMSMGKPVVVTSMACGSITAVDGTHFIRADKPEAFAAGVVDMLTNDSKRRWVGANAAAFVREYHDWDAISQRLESIYHEAREVFGAARTHAG